MLVSVVMLLVAEAADAPPPPMPVAVALADMPEPDPKKMSQAQIRAHNAKVPRDHPWYIRCVRREEIGSLVNRNFSCRTNQQWNMADEAGNRESREIADTMRSKAASGQELRFGASSPPAPPAPRSGHQHWP